MKSYYDAHESAYQQIKSKGFVGWGDKKNLQELGDDVTINYLKNRISELFPTTEGKSALDVGCGTGTTAFTLARMGFQVTGIDVSQTAIEMGQDLAHQQNLEIKFQVHDLVKMSKPLQKFDLIYDSHCLHCIVFENDRMNALLNIKNSLKSDGYFILDTMVMPTEIIDPATGMDTLRFDEDYILWHKTKPSQNYGIIEIDGQHWCAQRRIYPPDVIFHELKQAGFKVVSKQLDAQAGLPSMLRLVLQ